MSYALRKEANAQVEGRVIYYQVGAGYIGVGGGGGGGRIFFGDLLG